MALHKFRAQGISGQTPSTAKLFAVGAAHNSAALYTTAVVAEDSQMKGFYNADFTVSPSPIPAAVYRVIFQDATGRPIAGGIGPSTGVDGELVEMTMTPSLIACNYAKDPDVQTLLSRVNANAGTVLSNLFSMITGTGASAKFTALALQLGPNGADSMWTAEDIQFAKDKLAMLTLSGATIVVPAGAYMCARGDVENFYGVDNVAKWADKNNNGNASEISTAIAYAIMMADADIRAKLTGSKWTMPQAGDIVPAILVYHVAMLAGVVLYESRGVRDIDTAGNAQHQLTFAINRVDQFIKSVHLNAIDLSPLIAESNSAAPQAF